MSRALVLNATYEPLCVVPSRRAVVLVLGHKADVLHDTGEALHSEHLSLPVPSVIRLRHFVKVPFRRRAPLNRRGVFARDGHACQYCGAGGGEHRPRRAAQQGRRAHLGERGGGLPAVQRPQARPAPARDVDGAASRTRRAPRELTWVVVAVGTVPQHWEPYLHPATLSA